MIQKQILRREVLEIDITFKYKSQKHVWHFDVHETLQAAM